MMKEALLILGDQLFPIATYLPYQKCPVFMAEDWELCTHFRYHKHKIIFFLAAMRRYQMNLTEEKFHVHYEAFSKVPFMDRFLQFLKKEKITLVNVCEIQDKFFEKKFLSLMEKEGIEVHIIPSPMFLCSRQEFNNYLFYHPKPFMKTFYEKERKRLGILMDAKKKPVGGQWSYDVENRKKAPKELHNKALPALRSDHVLDEVIKLVEEEFPDHPGLGENFWLGTSRDEAIELLKHFLKYHLKDFGAYQDAITNRDAFLYHSILSPYINCGLLTPQEVIDHTLKAFEKDSDIPLHSVEGFIRQIMGWREFVRGIYQNFSEVEENTNFFNHQRRLTDAWYEGTTGLPPVDDAIKKAQDFGYCHHIERLMILSNVMLLSELHPHEVHKWFMEMFVDSADWVMGPNVFGMGQFSDGGIFATKPYISGSNYVLKMSDYKKGEWCEVWDGLYWRFIGKHRKFFEKNPRLNMMVHLYDKMDPSKRRHLVLRAAHFIEKTTV